MPITIDTLAAQRTMEAAGIEPAHAEAIVTAFAHTGDQVATKADLQSLEQRLEQRLEVEITGVKTEVAAVKTEVAAVKTEVAAVKTEVATAKTAFTARMAALEAKVDSKISALGNRILAAMLAFGGLLYAALRIF